MNDSVETVFAPLLRTMTEAAVVVGADGRVALWNAAAERLYAVAAADAIGRPVGEVFRWREEGAAQRVRAAVAAGGDWSGAGVHVTGAGRAVDVEVTATPLPPDGAHLLVVRDVTDRNRTRGALRRHTEDLQRDADVRREVQAELERTRHFLARLVETMATGVYVFDVVERCNVFANPELTRLTGYTQAELHSLGAGLLLEIIHPGDLAAVGEAIGRVVASGDDEVVEAEYRLRDKAKGWRLVHTRNVVFARDPGGTVRQLLGTVQDVTAQRATEAELARYRDRLEQMVEARTRQLEAVNAELESFSYSLAHDLRGPLRNMSAMAEIVLEDHGERLDEEARGNLQRIVRSAERANDLMAGLMRLANVSRAALNVGLVDLGALAREVFEELRAQWPKRAVELRVDDGLAVQGDPDLLRVALANLVGNAWKFTRDNEVGHIEVGAAVVDGGERAFFVRDDGVGFDPRFAHRIFEPFERLHVREAFEGAGIGLATVRRIVLRHGGRVWATGEAGRGATFWFTLPGAPRAESAGRGAGAGGQRGEA